MTRPRGRGDRHRHRECVDKFKSVINVLCMEVHQECWFLSSWDANEDDMISWGEFQAETVVRQGKSQAEAEDLW